ncbi:hypothetical protein C2S53_004598 [Perilla frutescens var. hirtella]|uniref:Uncharacterized protein n=1 Tax=Perilla frutescens var. hirtella TaxID=608512 RepID=A0AAD4PCL1_PERFH|nr:hypothetical protein C2S53_004598 [Perilla frutescens var. hirtella]
MHEYMKQYSDEKKFEQRSERFWELNQQSNSWVEVQLPYNLTSCIDSNCTVVNSIQESNKYDRRDDGGGCGYEALPLRKRISLTKMSETSVWVTGESGSIYERFWNGLQWVIAPHDLPLSAGYAVSVFMVNQTILALSQAGPLYQMQLAEDSQPIWVEFDGKVGFSSGVVSNDRERIYFCTRTGLLFQLVGVDPPRWENHGRPPGANVSSISDGAAIRPGLLLIVSAAGDLYEYDQTTKPPWKKHIHVQGSRNDTSLVSFSPCSVHGLVGPHAVSVFLLTKGGELIERRLHRRKWKWVVHGNPKGHLLTSITCSSCQDEPSNSNSNSLLLTTAAGFVFEYQIDLKNQNQDQAEEKWINHEHPPNARVARGIAGLQLQAGRWIFPLHDGRLAELHLSGLGGESLGPNSSPVSSRRKSVLRYVWSVLDAPESEGWNAEYCSEERGPSNCILGTKEETSELSISRWRKDSRKTQHSYLAPDGSSTAKDYGVFDDKLNSHSQFFRLRLMQGEKSFFLITENYMTFEYLNTENAWFWLRHEHTTGIQGALGNYNGSLFVVDEQGSLLIRERSSSDLAWINCTAMRKGRPVIGGPPWDGIPGQPVRAKLEDAIFFVSTTGNLLQFTVALRKFKWKDCKNPAGIKIASIVDQEGLRENVVFVVGRNGRLYQYNKVTQVWHQHYQSQHLVLSTSPGTAMRPSVVSPRGSLFMVSGDGGLVEYQWSPADGWNWIEHGTPHTNVALVGAPGPCFGGTQLFLIGSNGNVYLRYLDQDQWKWRHCGFPFVPNTAQENTAYGECADTFHNIEEEDKLHKHCNPKVSSTRPIPFSEDTVIFELQDGRLGEMRRVDDENWMWSRTIGTPTSLCMANFWTSWAT